MRGKGEVFRVGSAPYPMEWEVRPLEGWDRRWSISLEKWTKEHQGPRPLDPGAFYCCARKALI